MPSRAPLYQPLPRTVLPGEVVPPPVAATLGTQPQPFLNLYFDGPLPRRWPNDPQPITPDLIPSLPPNVYDGPGAKRYTDFDTPQQAAFLPVVVVAPPPPLNPYPESKPQPPRYPWEPMQETTYLPPKTLTGRVWDTSQGFRTKVWNGDIPLPSAIYLPTGGPTPPPAPTPAGRHRRHYVVRDGNRLLLFANKADADLYRRRLQRAAKPVTERRRLRVLVKEPEFVIDIPKTRTLAERHGQLGTFLEAASAKRGFVELVKIQSHLIAMEAARMREEEEIAIALLML